MFDSKEIEGLNKPVTIDEIELVILCLPPNNCERHSDNLSGKFDYGLDFR